MTITLILRPEVEAELSRKATLAGRALETYATELLEDAVHLPAPQEDTPIENERRSGQALVDAFADIRGLLTDEEIDTMFARNRSPVTMNSKSSSTSTSRSPASARTPPARSSAPPAAARAS